MVRVDSTMLAFNNLQIVKALNNFAKPFSLNSLASDITSLNLTNKFPLSINNLAVLSSCKSQIGGHQSNPKPVIFQLMKTALSVHKHVV